MPTVMFRIQSMRLERVQRVQTVQHLAVALLLIGSAWPHLRGGNSTRYLLSLLEIAGAATMIGVVIFERVLHSFKKHSSIGWVELGAAALTLVEAVERMYEPHTVALRLLSFVIPVILVIVGVFDVRPHGLHALKLSDDNLILRSGPFRRQAVSLENALSFRSSGALLEIRYEDGTRRNLDLRDVKNRDDAIAWAFGRMRERGLTAE